MADSAVESSVDVVDFLVGQHEFIKSLFDETLSASGKEREKLFYELRRLLAVHETAEEEIVHPRAETEIGNGDPVIQMLLQEENEAKTILGELEKIDVDDESFTRQLAGLSGAVGRHADNEERDEFATLKQEVSREELERMGRTVRRAEAVAPTRPHLRAESRSENLLIGPFAAMVDRARDAIRGKG